MHKKGFTFIELLLAVSIFAIVASVWLSTFTGGVNVWNKGNDNIAVNQDIRTGLNVISRDLINTVIYTGSESEWAEKSIKFFTANNIVINDEMLQEFSAIFYSFNSVDNNLMRKASNLKDKLYPENSGYEIIMDNVHNISFSYCYGDSETDSDFEWKNSWEDTEKPPKGVRIELSIKYPESDYAEIFTKTVVIPIGVLGSPAE